MRYVIRGLRDLLGHAQGEGLGRGAHAGRPEELRGESREGQPGEAPWQVGR
jgi:hypothetical protein